MTRIIVCQIFTFSYDPFVLERPVFMTSTYHYAIDIGFSGGSVSGYWIK